MVQEINDDVQFKQAGPNTVVGLETFGYGNTVLTNTVCLQECNNESPAVWGAECYMANNFKAPAADPDTEEGEIATRFMSMTSRESNDEKAYHGKGDHLAVFGSYVYAGGSGENFDIMPAGGMLVQASQQHEQGKLGTRLVFCYTKENTAEVISGAILDHDGTFMVGNLQILSELAHKYGKAGFFNAEPIDKPEVEISKSDSNITLENLINALKKLGLISTKEVA